MTRIAASFKYKLAVYFGLLTLLPLLVAFVGFTAMAQRSELRLADARLQAGLRATLAAYEEALERAERDAAALAASRSFQRSLLDRDLRDLRRYVRETPQLRIETRDGLRLGARPRAAAERRVAVLSGVPPAVEIGEVIAFVPFDSELVARLRARSGLDPGDEVILVDDGRILASGGAARLGGLLTVASGRPSTAEVGGEAYRVLLARTPDASPGFGIAVLTPQARIDAASRSLQQKLLLALLATLALVAFVVYLEGRSIVRAIGEVVRAANALARGRLSERVPVRGRDELALLARSFNEMASQLEARLADVDAERKRLRDATLRFGEALAASHDMDQLLRAIVDAAIESTGATSGMLLRRQGAAVVAGRTSDGEQRLELPLNTATDKFGTLVLTGPGFSIHDVETAAVLVGHAVVALDNARLHRIVEEQASFDGLTQLANRRACEATLAKELSRADRFGEPLAVVLADLDNFKRVNDAYGHLAGDVVLREFADTLRGGVRDIDVASRWGGEEFALVLPGTDADGAVQVAERIRRTLEQRTILTPDGAPLKITASFGVAAFPRAADAGALLAAADTALYDAKRAGKNRVAIAGDVVSVRDPG